MAAGTTAVAAGDGDGGRFGALQRELGVVRYRAGNEENTRQRV